MDNHGPARALARLTVAPALLLMAWLVVSLPLLMAGLFRIGPALALFVPVAALALILGFRGTTSRAMLEKIRYPASWWVVIGVAAVTIGFLVLELIMNSEQIVVRRDPASYFQFATWLTDHGYLPIPQSLPAFGGTDPALGFDSPAFYQVGTSIVPQFMAGWPLVMALGGWIGGSGAMLAMGPIVGALAVMSFGGLTARLVGPRWAPLGALALAITLPMQYVSRTTFSELPAMVLFFGGLSLLHDVRELQGEADKPPWKEPVRVRAFLAGLALGLIVLVRIDGIRDILPVVVFAGLLIARRRRTGLPLFLGLAIGTAAGLVEGNVLSAPYLAYLSGSLKPLMLMAEVLVAATVLMVTVLLWPVTGDPLRRFGTWVARSRIPDLTALGTIALMILFAVRPYIHKDFRVPLSPDDLANAYYVQNVQRVTHIPVEWGRQYTELSLYWVVWYIGLPALLLGTLGAALMVRRLLRRGSLEWTLPFALIAWTTVTTLIRPGITPDHPFASRRLISVVIPGLLLLAVWALAWCVRRFRRLGYGRRATGIAAIAGALLVLVPIAMESVPLMFVKTEQGEMAEVATLCSKIGNTASVLFVDKSTADKFSQVVRGMCAVPTAHVNPPPGSGVATQADVQRIIAKIEAAGRRPVILGANASDVAPYGQAQPGLHIRTRQDGRTLVNAPSATWRLDLQVWMSVPLSGG